MSVNAILTLGNVTAVLTLGEDGGPVIEVVQGSTALWNLTFKNPDNTAFDLTAATYTSGYLFDTQAVAAGFGLLLTGSFATVGAATLGTATFSPLAADSAVPGTYVFEIKITKTQIYYFRTPVTIFERYGV